MGTESEWEEPSDKSEDEKDGGSDVEEVEDSKQDTDDTDTPEEESSEEEENEDKAEDTEEEEEDASSSSEDESGSEAESEEKEEKESEKEGANGDHQLVAVTGAQSEHAVVLKNSSLCLVWYNCLVQLLSSNWPVNPQLIYHIQCLSLFGVYPTKCLLWYLETSRF